MGDVPLGTGRGRGGSASAAGRQAGWQAGTGPCPCACLDPTRRSHSQGDRRAATAGLKHSCLPSTRVHSEHSPASAAHAAAPFNSQITCGQQHSTQNGHCAAVWRHPKTRCNDVRMAQRDHRCTPPSVPSSVPPPPPHTHTHPPTPHPPTHPPTHTSQEAPWVRAWRAQHQRPPPQAAARQGAAAGHRRK